MNSSPSLAGRALLAVLLMFKSPGPRPIRDQLPQLFTQVDGVPDVNAWVMQRGGIMDFGNHRVMGLGLPLMRMLTRSPRAQLNGEL